MFLGGARVSKDPSGIKKLKLTRKDGIENGSVTEHSSGAFVCMLWQEITRASNRVCNISEKLRDFERNIGKLGKITN